MTERLRTPEDYELITYRLMLKLASQRVLNAEVYISVGVIFWRGQASIPCLKAWSADAPGLIAFSGFRTSTKNCSTDVLKT